MPCSYHEVRDQERTEGELGTHPLPGQRQHVYSRGAESLPLNVTQLGSSEMTSNMVAGDAPQIYPKKMRNHQKQITSYLLACLVPVGEKSSLSFYS